MKKQLLALAVSSCLANSALAECVVQDRTVTQRQYSIQERSDIRRAVVPTTTGERKCVVEFRVRIGTAWHQAHGEYVWDGVRPAGEACAAAVALAERDVQARLQKQAVINESVLVCSDNPDRDRLLSAHPGTVANLDRFRPHPDYPRSFYHNGTQCRYFLEATYLERDVRQYSGVICQLQDRKWVVVDRF